MALLRGRLVAFDSGTYTATVRLDGSAAMALHDLAVAANIPAAEMVSGRRVLADTGETGEVGDIVIYAVFP